MNPIQVKTLPEDVWNEKSAKSFKISKRLKKVKRYFRELLLFTLLGSIKD